MIIECRDHTPLYAAAKCGAIWPKYFIAVVFFSGAIYVLVYRTSMKPVSSWKACNSANPVDESIAKNRC
jgi:hypothetical protein